MITIVTTLDRLEQLQQLINSEYRLHELVKITTEKSENTLIDVSNEIYVLPDWENLQPPILLPTISYSKEILLGIVYAKLSNYEKAYELLQKHPTMLSYIDLLNRLQNGVIVSAKMPTSNKAVDLHNHAVTLHYGINDTPFSETAVIAIYEKTIASHTDVLQQQFSLYQLAQWYIDMGYTDKAENLIHTILPTTTHQKIAIAFKDLQYKIGLQKIQVPYDQALIEKVKNNVRECLQYYETNHRMVEAALTWMDASYIATIGNSFSEALGYITKSIAVFEQEQLEQFTAQAQLTKGNILQTWAQHGNPQFYRAAVQSYQAALRIFTKQNTPDIFADIQHQLGKVYAEIPDEAKKKGVWAAVSVASFNEALNYYTKVDFPYEFAMICHSFGNAYTKYPSAIHSDNFKKALAWYQEALDIRTAKQYPLERVLTLANYLEASWFVESKADFDHDRYNDMMTVAHEILQLTNDSEIMEKVQIDIVKLEQLKKEVNIKKIF